MLREPAEQPHHVAFTDLVPGAVAPGAAEPAVPTLDELITAWGLLSEATVVVSGRLSDGLGRTGQLSLPEFDVLIRLHREPGNRLPMSRIATDIGLSAGGFTKLADRLEASGLITRERSHADRRVVFAVLTDGGRQTTLTALSQHAADLRRHLLAPLGPQGLRALAALSRALRDENR